MIPKNNHPVVILPAMSVEGTDRAGENRFFRRDLLRMRYLVFAHPGLALPDGCLGLGSAFWNNPSLPTS
jgi:hypothetical protein